MSEEEKERIRALIQETFGVVETNRFRPRLKRIEAKGEFGRKGGKSATAGKKASFFLIIFPDGSTMHKRSFHVHDDEACVPIFYSERSKKWHECGVHSLAEPLHPNFKKDSIIIINVKKVR